MVSFVLSRLAQAIVVIAVVSFTVFLLSRVTGDPATLLLPINAGQEQKEAFRQEWGLDGDVIREQFPTWASKVIRGDLGTSLRARLPVTTLVSQRLPNSARLALATVVIAGAIGTLTGVASAIWRGRWPDWLFRGFAILGQGMPVFALALLLQALFAWHIPIFPVSGAEGWRSLVLPAATLGWFLSAGIMRLVRSAMIESLSSDYVLFARSKGLQTYVVVLKHALRNALIAPITFLGLYLGILIGAGVVVEYVFAYPGMGSLAVESVLARDFPTLQGVILVVTVAVILSNSLVDILYAAVDPRLRREYQNG